MTTIHLTGVVSSQITTDTTDNETIDMFNATVPGGVYVDSFLAGTTTINLAGKDTFDLTTYRNELDAGRIDISLAPHARWLGAFITGGSLDIAGGDHSVFTNDGTSDVFGANVVVDTKVKGTGSFEITRDSNTTGKLVFDRAVGAGQTVILTEGDTGVLDINDPRQFAGLVDIEAGTILASQGFNPDSAEINLNGIVQADAYNFRDDMLSIYSHGRVVDQLRLTSVASFQVEKTATGVSIYTSADTTHPTGTPLNLIEHLHRWG